MKNKIKLISLLTFFLFTGCNQTINSSSSKLSSFEEISNTNEELSSTIISTNTSSTNVEEKHKVIFKDGDKIICEVEGKYGEFVDIPDDLVNEDPRYTFEGWEGLDEYDYELGKVEIFEDDQIFTAKWYEQFGTSNEFSATKIKEDTEIVLDGELDDCYNSATMIPISTLVKGETNTSAEAYLMWDESFFYIFINVIDENVNGFDPLYNQKQVIEFYDSIQIWIDLLHNDSLAIPGYKDGWGGVYRGEPGPMCEALYKISAGFTPTEENRFGPGSEACWDGWLSNASNDDGITAGCSKITKTGYSVEYKILVTDNNIPEELRLKEGNQIGVGIKIYDNNGLSNSNREKEADNIIAMEYINGNMVSPKKLSNINLVTTTSDKN